jgi:hypothetical protein
MRYNIIKMHTDRHELKVFYIKYRKKFGETASTYRPMYNAAQPKKSRVTRLDDFSPIGQWLTFEGFLKNTKVAQKTWTNFHSGNSSVLILTRNGLGYILGDFFTNSSGRPDRQGKFFLL